MSALSGRALREQLSVIMGALTKAAVAEICEVVDEGYAVLRLEVSRSHKENEALRKKLHLIESIVVRGSGGGGGGGEAAAAEAEVVAAQRPDGGGGDAAVLREELPEVVLIKDEDSDDDGGDAFEDENQPPATREVAVATRVGRGMKRHWPGNEEAAGKKKSSPSSSSEQLAMKTSKLAAGTQKASVGVVYSLDSSPRSEPARSGPLGVDELEVCSYDPDVAHLVRREDSLVSPDAARQTYFVSGALMESRSPSGGAEPELADAAWTKRTKSQTSSFLPIHQSENVDAFGLKVISVSGSTSTDCQLSESGSSAFEYEDADAANFALYGDLSGRAEGGAGARGRRFFCSLCTKSYATSQNLDVHMRIHTGERPFNCSQCGKTFTQSAHLKSHLSVHSGERPYACAYCSRSFIVKYSLKLHVKKCHPSARE